MPKKATSHEQRQWQKKGKAHYDKQYDANERRTSSTLRTAKDIRSSTQWQKVRDIKIRRTPLCEDPMQRHLNQPIAAREVDHIVPLGQGGAPFDYENLQSLCVSCHAVKSRRETHATRTD